MKMNLRQLVSVDQRCNDHAQDTAMNSRRILVNSKLTRQRWSDPLEHVDLVRGE